jgi:hypothetical protein
MSLVHVGRGHSSGNGGRAGCSGCVCTSNRRVIGCQRLLAATATVAGSGRLPRPESLGLGDTYPLESATALHAGISGNRRRGVAQAGLAPVQARPGCVHCVKGYGLHRRVGRYN